MYFRIIPITALTLSQCIAVEELTNISPRKDQSPFVSLQISDKGLDEIKKNLLFDEITIIYYQIIEKGKQCFKTEYLISDTYIRKISQCNEHDFFIKNQKNDYKIIGHYMTFEISSYGSNDRIFSKKLKYNEKHVKLEVDFSPKENWKIKITPKN